MAECALCNVVVSQNLREKNNDIVLGKIEKYRMLY